MVDSSSHEGLCACPPRPDTLDRFGGDLTQIFADGTIPGHLHRRVDGLNDGKIYPESRFKAGVSRHELLNAALDRPQLLGNIKLCVVLVDFQGHPMEAGAQARMQQTLFSSNPGNPSSMTEYYSQVSGGKVSFSGDLYGPFTLGHTMEYYANNAKGLSPNPPNVRNMALDTLTTMVNNVPNWAQYDNAGDGYITGLVLVHAGEGAETTAKPTDLWSVKWTLPNDQDFVVGGGKKVLAFLTVPQDAAMGLCAHEIGHLVFGWPDLYDGDIPSPTPGLGKWCLMASGSWNGNPQGSKPSHPSAWCKVKQGWVTLTTEAQNKTIRLGPVETTKDVRRLWGNGNKISQEYFLIEDREKIDWDQALPGNGLMVWHVDDSILNNEDENHPKVALMEADGLNNLKIRGGPSNEGDPFPGSANNRTFNAGSNPNSNTYTAYPTSVSITNIDPALPWINTDISVVVPNWTSSVLAAGPSLSRGCNIAAISRGANSMEAFWITPLGALQMASWSGSQWQLIEMTTSGSAVPGGAIASVSKDSTHMSVFWTVSGGAIYSCWWNNPGWTTFKLAPSDSIVAGSRIAVTSRKSTTMEIFWVAPDGSIKNAWWYSPNVPSQWAVGQIAPAGSAAVTAGGIGAIAALARNPSVMEVWWVAPDLSIKNAWFSDGGGWNTGSTMISKRADIRTEIAAVSRYTTHTEIMYISSDGSVQDAWRYVDPPAPTTFFELAPPGSAAPGGIKFVSRRSNTMEGWWTATDGSVHDAYFYDGMQNGFNRYQLAAAGSARPGGAISAISRISNSMEVFYEGASGTVNDQSWYVPAD